jgi:hypothetical protein
MLGDLQAVWPIYDELYMRRAEQRTRFGLEALGAFLPALAVLLAALAILYLFYRSFSGLDLGGLSKPDTARGLLTFLFGVTTVAQE